MIVVIDTNVVIQASDGSHPYAKIIDGWVDGKFLWAVSTDINRSPFRRRTSSRSTCEFQAQF